jgi:hypothetical protein
MLTKRFLFTGVAAVAGMPALALAQGIVHKYLMRGQVLDVQDNALVVCVGTADGAVVGQELDVVRHVPSTAPSGKAPHFFRRENVGKVRITALVDDHYAQATVISGNIRVNDTVEADRS